MNINNINKENIKDFEIRAAQIIEVWLRSNEYKRRHLLEFLVLPAIISDRKGTVFDVNTKAHVLLGYKRQEMLGLNFSEIMPDEEKRPGEKECFKIDEAVYLRHKKGYMIPFFIESYQHKETWIHFLLEGEGYQRPKEALLISEQRYKSVLENALEGICIIGKHGFLACNKVFAQIFGYSMEEIPFLDPLNFIREEERNRIKQYLEVLYGNQLLVRDKVEYSFLRKDGTQVYCQISYFSTMYEGKFAVQMHVRDMEEMKHYKQKMRHLEEKYKLLLANSAEKILIVSGNKVVFANKEFCRVTGYTEDELKGLKNFEWIAPEYRRSFFSMIDRCQELEHGLIKVTADLVTNKGVRLPGVLTLSSVFYSDKPSVIVSWHNLRRDEDAAFNYKDGILKNNLVRRILKVIAESKCRDQAFFDLIKCLNEELPEYAFEIYLCNDDIVNIYTFKHGKSRISTVYGAEICKMAEDLEQNQFVEYRLKDSSQMGDNDLLAEGYDYAAKMIINGINGKIGVFKWAYCYEKIIVSNQVIADIISDISIALENLLYREEIAEVTKKNAEQGQNELFQRFALIGDMARSIAHEVRNPMTTIRGLAQMLAVDNPHHADYYNMMLEEIDRADNIIKTFLRLSRDIITEFKETDLDCILDKVLASLRREILLRKINLIREDAGKRCKVYVDQAQIEQALINILRNAVEASSSGSTIRVLTGREDNFIYIIFADEGEGIEADNLKRVMEPFFTTKDSNAGLGLSVSYKIIREHGGQIKVDSQLGKGTMVKVYLPIND